MDKHDLELLEKYAKAIFGCSYCDLSDKEEKMLMYHVIEKEPSFMKHIGVIEKM